MSNLNDLDSLNSWCRAKALEQDRAEDERRLFAQIANEISDYLGPSKAPIEAGLFDE